MGKTAETWFYGTSAGTSATLALASLYLAGRTSMGCPVVSARGATLIVGFWAVVPPLWLWVDWYFFRKPGLQDDDNRKVEIDQHSQSVIRALWAAVVGALAVGFKLIR